MKKTEKFLALDLIRGVAAIAVVVLHLGPLIAPIALPGGYLAVDLFFALSGFVIAHAYGERLIDGLGWAEFVKIRVIRLFPLYFLGLLIGILFALISIVALSSGGSWSVSTLLVATASALVVIPVPIAGYNQILPLNPPSWSLFFEMVINIAYAGLLMRFARPPLVKLLIAAAALLITAGLYFGDLDIGGSWEHFTGGFARVFYSFTAGLLVYRLHTSGKRFSAPAPLLVILVLAVFALPVTGSGRTAFDLIAVLVVFPLTVWAGASAKPVLAKTSALLGQASYAVYALHYPVMKLMERGGDHLLHRDPRFLAPWIGLAFVIGGTLAAILIDRIYDVPVRKWLSRRFTAKRDVAITAALPADSLPGGQASELVPPPQPVGRSET